MTPEPPKVGEVECVANGNNMPKPDAIWIALGIVAVAIAAALGPRRRRIYLKTLRNLATQHRSREKVIAFDARNPRATGLTHAISSAGTWIGRLLDEMEE